MNRPNKQYNKNGIKHAVNKSIVTDGLLLSNCAIITYSLLCCLSTVLIDNCQMTNPIAADGLLLNNQVKS